MKIPILNLKIQAWLLADQRLIMREEFSQWTAERGILPQDCVKKVKLKKQHDVIMFIYRDDYYNKESTKPGIADIIVAKQRNGSTGPVELVWLGKYTKFGNKERAGKKQG